ncbi:hypothetical protein [Streptomonospora arabica]|uniref:Uncharacterized protein n=1 Tax=Streptomonospora arabica TaxID=412417 RepID=A0ABV9SSR3_9ACTN
MPRIRSIKPDFFKSLTIGNLSETARLTFIGLWCYADDNGVAVDDARLIRSEVWPLDEAPEILQRIRDDLCEIEKAGLIVRYSYGGKPLLAMNSWYEHQKVSHPKEPRFPRPEDTPQDEQPPPDLRSREPRGDSGNPPEGSGEAPEDSGGSRSRARGRAFPAPSSMLPAPGVGGAGGGDDNPSPQEPPKPTFDDFWSVYPRRVGKTEARKAWGKALKRGADPEHIVEAARIYRDDPRRAQSDIKYTAHASTWLNQERYADEPEPPPQSNVVPFASRQQQSDDLFDRAMARAREREAQMGIGDAQ